MWHRRHQRDAIAHHAPLEEEVGVARWTGTALPQGLPILEAVAVAESRLHQPSALAGEGKDRHHRWTIAKQSWTPRQR